MITVVRADDEPTVSKVTSNSLAEVRTVIEAFSKQAPTNTALRPFVSASTSFWSGGVQAGESTVRISICDCLTISPCYEISATSVSPQKTRIDIRSLDGSADEPRSKFRPRRNERVMAELMRLLKN
jgi:hypothetical protein